MNMQTHAKKLLVVITEAALEKLLVRDVRTLGAHGYTVCDVRGGGEHGDREAEWEGNRSIPLEVIADEQSEAILLGRNVLNRLILLLDGPAQETDVLATRRRRRYT